MYLSQSIPSPLMSCFAHADPHLQFVLQNSAVAKLRLCGIEVEDAIAGSSKFAELPVKASVQQGLQSFNRQHTFFPRKKEVFLISRKKNASAYYVFRKWEKPMFSRLTVLFPVIPRTPTSESITSLPAGWTCVPLPLPPVLNASGRTTTERPKERPCSAAAMQ